MIYAIYYLVELRISWYIFLTLKIAHKNKPSQLIL